jgi:hypothetical protein
MKQSVKPRLNGALRFAVMVVSTAAGVALAGCGTHSTAVDGGDGAGPMQDGPADAVADACPDPFACFGDFRMLPDGGTYFCYRRPNSCTEEPCPLPPQGCPIA